MLITKAMKDDLDFFHQEQDKFSAFIEEHPIKPDLLVYFWEGWIARARVEHYKPKPKMRKWKVLNKETGRSFIHEAEIGPPVAVIDPDDWTYTEITDDQHAKTA
jgi:hypothetical protein